MVPIYLCLGGIYPYNVTMEFHLLCFEISKHIGKTYFVCYCFAFDFLKFVHEFFYLCACFHACGFVSFNNVGF
jgi:hypothetical protein